MKNLLDFYKKHVQIDPEVINGDILETIRLSSKFQGVTGLDYLYYVFTDSTSRLQTYQDFRGRGFPEYFKSVTGNKVIEVKEGGYIGVIDLWYPREIPMFDLIQNPICAGWVIQDLLGKMEKLEDILMFSNPAHILTESISQLLKVIEETEFYGFWMGDARNSGRKKSIKIRRLEVTKIDIPGQYYSSFYPNMTMRDKDTKEELKFNSYNFDGWCFYLSKELLAERLENLESFLMRDYDQKVRVMDNEIKVKKKELENLILKRKNFENGIDQYQKKIHDVLWKNF